MDPIDWQYRFLFLRFINCFTCFGQRPFIDGRRKCFADTFFNILQANKEWFNYYYSRWPRFLLLFYFILASIITSIVCGGGFAHNIPSNRRHRLSTYSNASSRAESDGCNCSSTYAKKKHKMTTHIKYTFLVCIGFLGGGFLGGDEDRRTTPDHIITFRSDAIKSPFHFVAFSIFSKS